MSFRKGFRQLQRLGRRKVPGNLKTLTYRWNYRSTPLSTLRPSDSDSVGGVVVPGTINNAGLEHKSVTFTLKFCMPVPQCRASAQKSAHRELRKKMCGSSHRDCWRRSRYAPSSRTNRCSKPLDICASETKKGSVARMIKHHWISCQRPGNQWSVRRRVRLIARSGRSVC